MFVDDFISLGFVNIVNDLSFLKSISDVKVVLCFDLLFIVLRV